MDSFYSPQWGDIEKVRAMFGISDSTIEQLVQEDESFRRVNGETVEYDLNKVYGHPKIQAFMAKVGSGTATAISYENIIRN